MTDTTGTKRTVEQSTIPFWRRIVLALGNIGFFVGAIILVLRLFQSVGGEEASWWIRAMIGLIFLIALVVVDVVLQAVLLRPARQHHAEPGATDD